MYETARPGRFVASCVEPSTEESDKLGQSPHVVVCMNLEPFDFVRSADFRGKLPQSNRDSPRLPPSFSAVSRPFTTSVSSPRVKIPPRVRCFECAIGRRISTSYIRFERHFMFPLNCMHAVFTSTRVHILHYVRLSNLQRIGFSRGLITPKPLFC